MDYIKNHLNFLILFCNEQECISIYCVEIVFGNFNFKTTLFTKTFLSLFSTVMISPGPAAQEFTG